MTYGNTRRKAEVIFEGRLDLEPNILNQVAWISTKALQSSVDLLSSLNKKTSTEFVFAETRLTAATRIVSKFDFSTFSKHWATTETRFGSYFRTTNSALTMAIRFSQGVAADVAYTRLNTYPNTNLNDRELDDFEDWRTNFKLYIKAKRTDLNEWSIESLWRDSESLQTAIEAELELALKSSGDLFHNYFSKHRGNGKSYGDPNPTGDHIVDDPIGAFIEECGNFAWEKQHYDRLSDLFNPDECSDEILDEKLVELRKLSSKRFRIRNSLQSLEDEVVDICLGVDLDPKPVHLIVQAVEHNESTFNEHLPNAIALLKTAKGKLRLSKGALPPGKRTKTKTILEKKGKAKAPKKRGRKVKNVIAETDDEKKVLNLHFDQDKSAAIIAQDAFGDIDKQGYVQTIINRLSARKKRKKEREKRAISQNPDLSNSVKAIAEIILG